MQRKKKPNYYHIGSLEKGISILKILAAGGTMSLAEIANESKLDRSGCHRYLLTFRDLGLLSKIGSSGYRLTTGLFEISMTYINRLGVREIVRPFMEELSLKYKEAVNLGVKDGDQIVFLDKLKSQQNYRAELSIGTRHPIHCTALGKALMAFRPENEQVAFCDSKEILESFTPNTITSPQAFKEELLLIRSRGFSIDNEEYFSGLHGVAAPITDFSGFSIYSMSVAGPISRLPMDVLFGIGDDLKQLCARISTMWGKLN
jgi:IclR family acetate operon transcriptional repressor